MSVATFRRFSQNCEKWLLASCLSFRLSAWNNSALTGRIFMKFDIWLFFQNLSRKFKFHSYRTRITGTLREDQCTFCIISGWFLLGMKNVSNKSYRENRITHFMFSNFFFPPENHAMYDTIWKKKIVERAGHTWQYGACAPRSGYLWLRKHTQVLSCSCRYTNITNSHKKPTNAHTCY
jgi:hypothetical protein